MLLQYFGVRCMAFFLQKTTWPLPPFKDTSFHNSTREEAKLLLLQTIYIPRGGAKIAILKNIGV